jgi:hypothetical protein
MNGRRLTDAQISQALRAHLPDRAWAGLSERILEATGTTPQQRVLPSFLGALSDADPVSRRRSLLIAAALLVAIAVASAAAAGAWRLLDRDPIQDLGLKPPADVPGFVQSSDDRMPELPPVAITTLDSDASKGRIYVDRSGAVRIERYASADATEPVTTMILSGKRFGRTVSVGPDTVWVERDEAIGEDPRVYMNGLGGLGRGVSCEETDSGDQTAPIGWTYVGSENVAGRPTYHVACNGDLWIDIETRLVLRSRAPRLDDRGQPIPGAFQSIEVTDIEFAEQPAALFQFAPPQGVARMSSETYDELCGPGETAFGEGPPCSGTPPPPEAAATPPTTTPTPTVRPSPSDCAVPPRDPSEPTGPLTWTQASLKEDWPAPVRPEPAGAALVLPWPETLAEQEGHHQYTDPSGDTGSDCYPWVDIREIGSSGYWNLVSNQPPVVHPNEQWIAYGAVFDVDSDGVPDWRYGMDNMPVDAKGERPHRVWVTDLHSGLTEAAAGPPYGAVVGDSFYPNGGDFGVRIGIFGPGRPGHLPKSVEELATDVHFYVWASVIQDGRVVATDYAPDAGWLDPSILGVGQNEASPFGGVNTVCVVPPQPGCRETDMDEAISFTFTLPDGWTWNDADKRVDDRGKRVSVRDGLIKKATGRLGPRGMSLEFLRGGWLYSDPCRKVNALPDIRVGPTANDFADALAAHPLLDVTTPVRVTLGGHSGKYMDLQVPPDIAECTAGYLPWAPTYYAPGPNHRWHIWSLDVDGVRVVVLSEDFAGTSPGDLAEMHAIIESIQINP